MTRNTNVRVGCGMLLTIYSFIIAIWMVLVWINTMAFQYAVMALFGKDLHWALDICGGIFIPISWIVALVCMCIYNGKPLIQ